MAAALTVEDLNVRLRSAPEDVWPVRGVSFTIEPGEVLGIVGESGSGKSLTASAIMGLLPSSLMSSARRLEMDAGRAPASLRGDRIGLVFQDPLAALNPLYRIGTQLKEPWLRHRKGGSAAALQRARMLLEQVGIKEVDRILASFPHQISGGQRQRVMIATALMCGPSLLIADEPTTALDVTTQAQILLLLKELQKEMGLSVLFITHDLGVVAQLADKVGVMYQGEIVESLTTDELFRRPSHPYTRRLLDAAPRINI